MGSTRSGEHLLSALEVKNALQKGEECKLADGGGLTLHVRGKNKGTWTYRSKVRGERKNTQVSWPAPRYSLADARKERDKARDLMQQGINPNEERRRLLLEQVRASKTFADVADEYLASRQDLSVRAINLERGRVKNHMASLKSMRIADIRRGEHIRPVLDRLVHAGRRDQATRVAGLIERIFKFALNNDYIEANCATDLNSLLPRRRQDEQAHHPAAKDIQSFASVLTRLWDHMDISRSSPEVKAAIKLTCYMPARNGNIVAAKWDDLDLEKGLWHFPKTKNGRSYTVPMTPQIRAVFDELVEDKRDEWCFPSYGKKGHITDASMRKFLREAGIPKEEQSLHGFRSSFQTICLEKGLPKILTEQLLFHVAGGAVERAYNRARYVEPIGQVLQWWNDTGDALRTGKDIPEIPEELRDRYR